MPGRDDRHRHPRRVVGSRTGQQGVESLDSGGEFVVGPNKWVDHGIAEEHRSEAAVADGELDESADRDVAPCLVRTDRFGDLDQPGDVVEHRADQRQHDVLFGVELVVDRGLGDAHPIGDHLQGGPADAVLGEELEGRL